MELKHIDISRLSVSGLNMRGVKRTPDIDNILPSVRARGILVPLIVREKPGVVGEGSGEGEAGPAYEIIAGKRRYHSALVVAQENDGIDPLPCAVMEAGDDAAALEASLIENIARLDPDEMTQYETFVRLVREGRSVEELSLTFGLTPLQVKKTLALGNLLPRIRNLYRAETIDVVTVRHLTLASKARQRDWLALLDDETAYAPTGSALKAWLFGGASIPVKAALFDVASYAGEVVSDLFGDDSYFASAEAFWTAQLAAVEERAEAFRAEGWTDVIVMERGHAFHSWEYERTPKRKGGKVYVAIGQRGDVSIHEGYLTSREADRMRRGEQGATNKPARPEVSSATQSYIDLHRHAAVRAELASSPSVALRVMVAHAVAGSSLWRVSVEPQRAHNDAIAESVETSASETAFDAKRREILALLGFDPETDTVTGGYAGEHGLAGLVAQLLTLSDSDVLSILAIVMGETLEAGSALVEYLGVHLGVNMANCWQADDALFDGIRDREVLGHLLAEVSGAETATANAKATAKVQRGILKDCLEGTNGRAKVEGYVPGWMTFPPQGYTERGGVGSIERAERIAELTAPAFLIDPVRLAEAA